MAGGYDPERLRVCLVVEDERPLCTSGFESIAFGRREWDIRHLRGRLARLEIVDDSDAHNGVIMVDEVRQWTAHPALTERGAKRARARRDPMPPGRWQPVDEGRVETPEQLSARRAAQLEALGYLDGSELPRSEGLVTIYDPERAVAGVNFYVSGHEPAAFLVGMDGMILHRWQRSFRDVWPERSVVPHNDFWRRAHVF